MFGATVTDDLPIRAGLRHLFCERINLSHWYGRLIVAELGIAERPAASVGVTQNHPPEVPAARLGAAGAIADRDDGDARRYVDVGGQFRASYG